MTVNTIDDLKRQLYSLGMSFRNQYAEWPDYVILGSKERGLIERYSLSTMKPSEIAKGDLSTAKTFMGFKIIESVEADFFAVTNQLITEEQYAAVSNQELTGDDLFAGENRSKFLGIPLVKVETTKGDRYGIVLHITERNPTLDAYNELNQAFDYFNKTLFEDQLPKCLITMQREKRSYGYLSRGRFVNKDGERMDELALNPSYFGVRSIAETLSTLVHEMCHLWQHHFGKTSRNGYHNSEWADKMEQIGLMPSHNGLPKGKRVGQNMTHYIIEGGPFELACSGLLSKEFTLSWYDRFPPVSAERIETERKFKVEIGALNPMLTELQSTIDKSLLEFEPAKEPAEPDEKPKPNKSNRLKYRCPTCKTQVWGKPDLKLKCGDNECKDAAYEVVE